MHFVRCMSLATLFVLALTGGAFAGGNPDVEIAIDCKPHAPGRECGELYGSCQDIDQVYAGTGEYDLIVVVYNHNGIRAADYLIDYSDVEDAEFIDFLSCSLLDIRQMYPGMFEIVQAWSTCEMPMTFGEGFVLGWMRLAGSAGRIDISHSLSSGDLAVVDCGFKLDPIKHVHAGFVGGALPGPGDIPPCGGATSTEGKTWGGVKSLYQ